MAVSDQEVAAWLAANPTATPAEIAQAASAAGVTSAQFERATGQPAPFETTYGGELNLPIATSVKQNIGGDIVDIQYDAAGRQISATGQPKNINGQTVVTDYSPTGQTSYRLYNGPNMLGEMLNAGSFLLKGYGLASGLDALLGSLGGLGSNAASAAADADIAGGMVPEYGTNAAYDAFMANAMTPEALAALEKQIAESSVGGLSYQDILNQGGLITDMASGNFMGPLTADELGNAFEKYMADSGYFPVGTVTPPGGAVLPGETPAGTKVLDTASKVVDPEMVKVLDTAFKVVDPEMAKVIASGVTKVLPGLLTAGALSQMTNKPSVGALPTQGVPTNSPEYYQAIQQYYNTYMPEQPRDVATPLQQWYDSKYGA